MTDALLERIPSTGSGVAERAIVVWNSALLAIGDQEQFLADAAQAAEAAQMVVNGHNVMRIARPNLIEVPQTANDQRVVDAVSAALVGAWEAAVADPELAHGYLGQTLDGPTARFLKLPPGYPEPIVAGRFDGARHRDGLKILEFNGGLPGGVRGVIAATELMRSWPPFGDLDRDFQLQLPDMGGAWVAALIDTWHAFGGTGLPRVAFAFPHELSGYLTEAATYYQGLTAAAGLEAQLADPGEFSRHGGALWLRGQQVDLVVRVFFTTMLATLGSRIEALMGAVAAGEACLVTSFRAGMYGYKSLFAMVTDPAVELDVDPGLLGLAREHLPWTRLLTSTRTTAPDGSQVDLPGYLQAQRDQLVLKPVAGSGGAGVTLGWDCSPPEWTAALSAAQATGGGWVVQERLDLVHEEFPALAPGFPQSDYVVDHNPVVLNGRIAGYFVRPAAAGGVTNLTSGGGSMVPTFVVSEKLQDPGSAVR